MMSGHCLLKILAGFAWTMLSAGGLLTLAHFFIINCYFRYCWFRIIYRFFTSLCFYGFIMYLFKWRD
jgi:hypothetical protein